MSNKDNTEERILKAAQKIFTHKGMAGARMQEIADEAGINKALLHYYFRNKDKLFRRIFQESFEMLISQVSIALDSDKPLFDKIRDIIDTYINVLTANPSLPIFVLSEINQNPDNLEKVIGNALPPVFQKLFIQVEEEVKNGSIYPIHPLHLLLNILGMVIFPFASRPLLQRILKNNMNINFEDIMIDRKQAIYTFVIQSLTKK
jgi:TetR/AcrR family transcriptional regulator